ncbi:MAG: queuosine precursor transporter [Limnochordia bacterium]
MRYPIYLVGMYLACELVANITAGKITVLGPFSIPVASYVFALAYTLLDLINYALGPREARRVVTAGFLANAILAGYSLLTVYLPPAPFWEGQEAYARVLGSTPRVVLASLIAYLVSSNLDVSTYAWLSQRMAPWGRVLLSNAVGLGVDTLLFITIAFYGKLPLRPLIGGQYAVKMAVTVISIPLIYLFRAAMRRSTVEHQE